MFLFYSSYFSYSCVTSFCSRRSWLLVSGCICRMHSSSFSISWKKGNIFILYTLFKQFHLFYPFVLIFYFEIYILQMYNNNMLILGGHSCGSLKYGACYPWIIHLALLATKVAWCWRFSCKMHPHQVTHGYNHLKVLCIILCTYDGYEIRTCQCIWLRHHDSHHSSNLFSLYHISLSLIYLLHATN